MSKYRMQEQKACHLYSSSETRKSGRPLPDMGEQTRQSSSVRRYPVHMVRAPIMTEPPRKLSRRETFRLPLPMLLIVGMGLMLALILSLGSVPSYFQNISEQWSYGKTRTFHTDQRVGHGDALTPSHFIAMNYRSTVHIIEFPGGDAEHALVYVGPQLGGIDAEHAPVTLSFRDVSGDQKPDMLIMVRSMVICVFINDTIRDVPQFRPARVEELLNV